MNHLHTMTLMKNLYGSHTLCFFSPSKFLQQMLVLRRMWLGTTRMGKHTCPTRVRCSAYYLSFMDRALNDELCAARTNQQFKITTLETPLFFFFFFFLANIVRKFCVFMWFYRQINQLEIDKRKIKIKTFALKSLHISLVK